MEIMILFNISVQFLGHCIWSDLSYRRLEYDELKWTGCMNTICYSRMGHIYIMLITMQLFMTHSF